MTERWTEGAQGRGRKCSHLQYGGLVSPAVTSLELFGRDSVTSSAHVLKESGHAVFRK